MSEIEAADFNYVLSNDSWYDMMQWRPLTVTACRTTWGSWWFNLLTMAFRHSLAPFLCCCTWSQRSIICPQSSAVFFASVTFSMVWGEKIVKMSNDKFGSFFPVFLIKLTYDPIEGIWGGEDPHFEFWHTYLYEFLSNKGKNLNYLRFNIWLVTNKELFSLLYLWQSLWLSFLN